MAGQNQCDEHGFYPVSDRIKSESCEKKDQPAAGQLLGAEIKRRELPINVKARKRAPVRLANE